MTRIPTYPTPMAEKIVAKDQLRIGLFIHLDLPWMKHPFMTNSFKIRNQEQLSILKKLRISGVRVDPEKSDVAPGESASATPVTQVKDDVGQALWEEKKRRIRILKERRIRLNRCAKRYTKAVGSARKLMSRLMATPVQAVEEADELVVNMVDELTGDTDATIQLVNLKSRDENAYHHAINVAALTLTLGRKLDLNKQQLRQLGMGALFHDLGHQQVPYQVLHKKSALTQAERLLYERHPLFGSETAKRIGNLPKGVMDVILQHHENLDGSGFPQGLRGTQISLPARVINIANRYDNLCNGSEGNPGRSPYEAVSHMYSRERARYEPRFLNTFISNMGVYPPGTLVKLQDDRIAVVISINPRVLLKPNVLVYSPDIPKEEALILDLAEEKLDICEGLQRADLSAEVLDYLNISDNVSYYFDSTT